MLNVIVVSTLVGSVLIDRFEDCMAEVNSDHTMESYSRIIRKVSLGDNDYCE